MNNVEQCHRVEAGRRWNAAPYFLGACDQEENFVINERRLCYHSSVELTPSSSSGTTWVLLMGKSAAVIWILNKHWRTHTCRSSDIWPYSVNLLYYLQVLFGQISRCFYVNNIHVYRGNVALKVKFETDLRHKAKSFSQHLSFRRVALLKHNTV